MIKYLRFVINSAKNEIKQHNNNTNDNVFLIGVIVMLLFLCFTTKFSKILQFSIDIKVFFR